jgi:hypothetical protein
MQYHRLEKSPCVPVKGFIDAVRNFVWIDHVHRSGGGPSQRFVNHVSSIVGPSKVVTHC